MTRRGAFLYLAGMAAAVLLPIFAARVHPLPAGRCERDGVDFGDAPAARVVDRGGAPHEFCSIRCAESWIERRSEQGVHVLVRDEAGGGMIEARAAWFVRSRGTGASGGRTHAFARPEDAAAHAAAFGGAALSGGERPFRDADRP